MNGAQQSKALAGSNLSALVSHPLRVKVLLLLRERVASPAELSHELGEEVSTIAYHVRVLDKLGAIELVKTQPVRGSTEHFYRATKRPALTDAEFAAMDNEKRKSFALTSLQYAVTDATVSMQAGVYTERPNCVVVHYPLYVDEQGWSDLAAIFREAVERIPEIEAEAIARGNPAIGVRVVSQVFEMPDR